MKTNTITANTIAPAALVNEKPGTVETIRSVDVLTRDVLDIAEDGKVSIRKGAEVTASELAQFIADRELTGARFKTQARWAYYSAGQQPNGTTLQQDIAKRLKEMMSPSAFHQLKSEATTIAPLAIAEGFKTPLSVLKDAMAELAVNPQTGRLLPLAKQSKAGRKLIPLLKEGKVTQNGIRDIRKEFSTATVTGNAKPSNPKAKEDAEKSAITAQANAIGALQQANKYVDGTRLEGDQRQAFVNVLTDIARKLGLALVAPGEKTPTPTPPAAPVKK